MFVEVKNLKKDYGIGENVVHVLKGLNFQLEKGEICTVLGPSGAGKSTLLNLIGGIDTLTSGEIRINGKKIDAPFAMIIFKEDSVSHAGRRHLKFSPKIFFKDKTGYIHTNEEFMQAAYNALGLSPDACWFVYKMEIENLDELHMSAIIVRADASVLYADSKERAAEWRELVNQATQNQ